jgi:hypothetical protein
MNGELEKMCIEVIFAFKVLFQNFPGGAEENPKETFIQNSRCPSRDLNPRSTKYEAELSHFYYRCSLAPHP